MLKKINRIHLRDEFSEVLKKGRMIQTPLFGVKILKKNEGDVSQPKADDVPRFGFVVSKKISKRAVDRNKIKRRLCQVLQGRLEEFPEGTRMVFLVRKAVLTAKMEEIERVLKQVQDDML